MSVKMEVTPQRVSLFKRRRRPRVSDVPPVKSFIRHNPVTATSVCVCGTNLFKRSPPKTCLHFKTSMKKFVTPSSAEKKLPSEVITPFSVKISPKSMLTPAAAAEFSKDEHDDNSNMMPEVINSGG